MLSEWLFTLSEKHRPGIGVQPWIKYIDMGYDNRIQNTFYVRLRGFSWTIDAHSSRKGTLKEQILRDFELIKKSNSFATEASDSSDATNI